MTAPSCYLCLRPALQPLANPVKPFEVYVRDTRLPPICERCKEELRCEPEQRS